jgi:hypothetical protein
MIQVGHGWVLAHSKSEGYFRLDQFTLRNLVNEGPLQLYHMHEDNVMVSISAKMLICGAWNCGVKPPQEVLLRAAWIAHYRGKRVRGDANPHWPT